MRKPMLTSDQLIDYMKSRGIRFDIIDEAAARRQLQANNNYFKLTSFCDNFSLYTSGPNAGQYERLDFACLQELLMIDLEVRHLLLDMTLDIEHALKVALISFIEQRMRAGQEDGYRIVRDFLLDEGNPSITDRAERIDYRAGNFAKKVRQNRKNPYCDVLIAQYSDEMPVWAYVELITFGELQEFAEYCQQRIGWQPPVDLRSVDRVRQLRNACAHGNCIIHDLRPVPRPENVSNAPRHITDFLTEAGVRPDARIKKLSNPRINQIVHTLYTYDHMVRDPAVRELRLTELQRLMNERIPQRAALFRGNSLLSSCAGFFRRITDRMRP